MLVNGMAYGYTTLSALTSQLPATIDAKALATVIPTIATILKQHIDLLLLLLKQGGGRGAGEAGGICCCYKKIFKKWIKIIGKISYQQLL